MTSVLDFAYCAKRPLSVPDTAVPGTGSGGGGTGGPGDGGGGTPPAGGWPTGDPPGSSTVRWLWNIQLYNDGDAPFLFDFELGSIDRLIDNGNIVSGLGLRDKTYTSSVLPASTPYKDKDIDYLSSASKTFTDQYGASVSQGTNVWTVQLKLDTTPPGDLPWLIPGSGEKIWIQKSPGNVSWPGVDLSGPYDMTVITDYVRGVATQPTWENILFDGIYWEKLGTGEPSWQNIPPAFNYENRKFNGKGDNYPNLQPGDYHWPTTNYLFLRHMISQADMISPEGNKFDYVMFRCEIKDATKPDGKAWTDGWYVWNAYSVPIQLVNTVSP